MSTKSSTDSLYEDTGGDVRLQTVQDVQNVRTKYYLDLSGSTDAMKPRAGDGSLLKLISPELEKYMAQNGAVVTTPTPTTQIFYPKAVTEEQEAYARGFIDALAKLHQRQSYAPLPTSTLGVHNNEKEISENFRTESSSLQTVTFNLAQSIDLMNNSGSFNNSLSFPTSGGCLTYTIEQNQQAFLSHKDNPEATTVGTKLQLPILLKEEPQTVPCLEGGNRPESPMCVDSERLEIKRARNRLAAQRCRGRKLERIVVLSDRVSVLKGENAALESKSATLRQELAELRRELMNHVENGCRVMISGGEQNLASMAHSVLPLSSSSEAQVLDGIGSGCTNASDVLIPCAMNQSEGMSYSVVPPTMISTMPQEISSVMPQAMTLSSSLPQTLASFNFFVFPTVVAAGNECASVKQEFIASSIMASSPP